VICCGCTPQGVDWASLNADGQPLKPDLLTDAWTACEPSDALPPGCMGPDLVPDKFCSPLQYAADSSGDEASGKPRAQGACWKGGGWGLKGMWERGEAWNWAWNDCPLGTSQA